MVEQQRGCSTVGWDRMSRITSITDDIKTLKRARDLLRGRYERTEYHQKREIQPHSAVPPEPEDEEILKLLTAIQQLEHYIKELQNEQFSLLKEQE